PLRPVRGHFILDAAPLEVREAKDYPHVLERAGIVAEPTERRARILAMLHEAARAEGLQLVENAALLDEVNFLVERPTVIVGCFAQEYLRLPEAVILSEMNQHQRYFGLTTTAGKLANQFLIVANGDAANPKAIENIRSGNERVLRARLADGAFFYDEDLKRPLPERIEDLKQIVFHDGLATFREKVERMGKLAALFAQNPEEEPALAQAARLAKADLTTHLVYEFDHLQGEIGAVYAAAAGLPQSIVTAIREHYLPRFQGDALPQTRLGALLSLADKWDNILAAFLLGKEPTATQDPLAIRRQALAIIQILVAQKIRLSLGDLVEKSLPFYQKDFRGQFNTGEIHDKVVRFFKARLATIFEQQGFDKKLARAAIFSGADDAFDLFARATALRTIAEKDSAHFAALLAAFRRLANILDSNSTGNVDTQAFVQPEEKALWDFVQKLRSLSRGSSSEPVKHYEEIFTAFAEGKPVVDAFFDRVMVNHSDPKIRSNRRNLVGSAVNTVRELLDLDELA
ncbi:MAG: glycine--tRNA ligase subunit beta, partial [Leptospiraceae bacterium]|nr:glycine--tRNA ligase subunit beta [Leptospiraceae bacterium]